MAKNWDVPGLPDEWPELVADALSELNDVEFREAWRMLGDAISARSRLIRRDAEAI